EGAERPVVVRRAETAIDLGRGEHEPAPLAQVDDFLHQVGIGWHAVSLRPTASQPTRLDGLLAGGFAAPAGAPTPSSYDVIGPLPRPRPSQVGIGWLGRQDYGRLACPLPAFARDPRLEGGLARGSEGRGGVQGVKGPEAALDVVLER